MTDIMFSHFFNFISSSEWLTEEDIPENGAVFDMSEEDPDHIFDGIE